MINIDIELWPHGYQERSVRIGQIEIINDGTGTLSRGNYVVKLYRKNSTKVWKEGRVENFPRKRLNSYDLLLRGLKSCGLEQRK